MCKCVRFISCANTYVYFQIYSCVYCKYVCVSLNMCVYVHVCATSPVGGTNC